jgi:hypothetical protein
MNCTLSGLRRRRHRGCVSTTRAAAFIASSAVLAACGGGGGGGGSSMAPAAPPPGGGNPTLEATFASIQANVFDAICTACHIGASAPLGLRLDAANSYGLLVGVASVQQPSLERVAPNDPDNSYLIRKLEGTAGVGGRMPLGGTPLSQADINVIRQWIIDGAQRDVTQAPAADPIRVSSVSPLPDSDLSVLPATIMVLFDRDLDASTVNTATLTLERSGGDGTFGDGNEVAIVPASISVPAANPRAAVVDLTGVASVADTYRATVAGSGPSTVMDLDANSLDGEFAGTFPSGDGAAGGDFVVTFAVVGLQPTLQSIQDVVFTPICSACHTGPSGGALPAGMDLTSLTASFMSLVGVASTEAPAVMRVAPGDPDSSYLIHKLEGTATVGDRMPFGGPPLDQSTIDAIRQWITDGAAM